MNTFSRQSLVSDSSCRPFWLTLQEAGTAPEEAAPSTVEQVRQEVLRLLEKLPQDALQPSHWAPATELAWHSLLTSATCPQVLPHEAKGLKDPCSGLTDM